MDGLIALWFRMEISISLSLPSKTLFRIYNRNHKTSFSIENNNEVPTVILPCLVEARQPALRQQGKHPSGTELDKSFGPPGLQGFRAFPGSRRRLTRCALHAVCEILIFALVLNKNRSKTKSFEISIASMQKKQIR